MRVNASKRSAPLKVWLASFFSSSASAVAASAVLLEAILPLASAMAADWRAAPRNEDQATSAYATILLTVSASTTSC